MPPEEKLKTEAPQHKVGMGLSGCTSARLGHKCGFWTMQDSGDRKDEERRATGKQVTEGLGQLCLVPHSEGKKSQWGGGWQVEWKERRRALTLSVLNAVHSTDLSPAACSEQPLPIPEK